MLFAKLRIFLAILVAILVIVIVFPFVLNMVGFAVPQFAFVGGASSGGVMESGIWRSVDGGESWKEIRFQAKGEPMQLSIQTIFFHPSSSAVIFMGTNGSGLWKSESSGASWKRISDRANILQSDSDVRGVAVSLLNPAVIYLAVYQNGQGVVLKSVNNGLDFVEIYHLNGGGVPIVGLYIFPESSNRLLIATANGGLLKTNDAGKSWNAISWDIGAIAAINVNPLNPNEIIIRKSGGKIARSLDGGKTWADININGSGNSAPGFYYSGPRVGGIGGNGVNSVTSDGVTGSQSAPFDPGAIFPFLNNGSNDFIMNASETRYFKSGDSLFRSNDGGTKWVSVQTLLPPRAKMDAVSVDPNDAESVFFASSGELHKSLDGGSTWKIIGLPMTGRVQSFWVNPYNTNIMFVVTR